MKIVKTISLIIMISTSLVFSTDKLSIGVIGGYAFAVGETFQGSLSYQDLEYNYHVKDIYFDSFGKGYSFRTTFNYHFTENLIVDIESGLIYSSDYSYTYKQIVDYNFVTIKEKFTYYHVPVMMHLKVEIGGKYKIYSGIGFGTMFSDIRVDKINEYDNDFQEVKLYPELPFLYEGVFGFSIPLSDKLSFLSELRILMANFLIKKSREEIFYFNSSGSYSGDVTYIYERDDPQKKAPPTIGGNSLSFNIGFSYDF